MLSTKDFGNNANNAQKSDVVEMEHSPLGPSSSPRWINCTGSVLLTQDMPDEDRMFAMEGTAAHTLSEWCRDRNKPAKDFRNQQIDVRRSDGEIESFIVDQEMVDGVQDFLDYVYQFDCDVEIVEEKVHYTAWVEKGFGTLDSGQVSDCICRVTDLKYGKGIQVYAKNNTQLMLYALGIFQEYSHIFEFKKFILTIHQPRLNHVDEWEVDVKDLIHWANTVAKPKSEEALSGNGKLVAGEWCDKGFCAARFTCPVRAEWISEMDRADFESLDDDSTKDIELLDDMEISALLDHKAAAVKFWKDIEEYAFKRLQAGEFKGDRKLVEGRSAGRKWRNADAAEAAMRKNRKIKVGDMFVSKLISAPQFEKKFGKAHAIMTEHVVKPQGKPVMVHKDDPREEYQARAEDEFDNLDEE